MAKAYKRVDREQRFLLPPDLAEWLPEGHLAWFVIDAVSALDTSAFHAGRRLGGVGRQGYDPDMLLALLIYCYAGGVRSSRRIENACRVDVACRVICANQTPDHSVIARFRAEHEVALRELFAVVTAMCVQAGLAQVGVLAIDGTKVAANASRLSNRTLAKIRAEIDRVVEEAAAIDAAEDARFGDQRGDELRAGMARRRGRVERLRRCAEELQEQMADSPRVRRSIERVQRAETNLAVVRAAQQAKVDAYARAVAAGQQPARRPVPAEEHSLTRRARERLANAHRALEAAQAAAGRSHSGQPLRRNVTDPDSQMQRSQGRWVQGYNCQAAFAEDGIAVAAAIAPTPSDTEMLHPLIAQARRVGAVEHVLADAGYYSLDNVAADLTRDLDHDRDDHDSDDHGDSDSGDGHADGTPRLLIPPPRTAKSTIDHTADRAQTTDLAAVMRHRLASPDGKALYRRRAPLAEGPFGHLKSVLGFTQFSRRGRNAADAEWHFILAVRNLLLLHRAGHHPVPTG